MAATLGNGNITFGDGTTQSTAGAPLNGTGASGTWGISISGNAVTATTATNWAAMPAGTRLMFAQSAAPTGWTQVTDDTANNRMLRVVTGAGNGTGGSHSPILNNVVPSHTHGFTTGNVSADHTHGGWSAGVSANHYHTIHEGSSFLGLRSNGLGELDGLSGGWAFGEMDVFRSSSTTWQSEDHAHYTTTGGASANHTHSGTTDNGSSQTNWTPRYIDMILCSKN